MARIQEEVVIITVSKLKKNTPNGDTTDSDIVSATSLSALEDVAQELFGSDVVVEINKA